MLSRVFAAQLSGLVATTVTVEVDVRKGMHAVAIVGLPDKATQEAKDRILTAVRNAELMPEHFGTKRVVIALAPADLKKEGSSFDLAITMGFLLAAEKIHFAPAGKLFLGELALDGTLRPIRGALLLAQHAKKEGFTELYVPAENALEASLVEDIAVYGVPTLGALVDHLDPAARPGGEIRSSYGDGITVATTNTKPSTRKHTHDFADVRGQETGKRGLEIAAAGGHNVLMYGPPGTGKSMLGKAFPSILPELPFEEMLEVMGIHSAAGTLVGELVSEPPLRAPHHSASHVAIVGGGTTPQPGEMTLAHRGVLFLDEFPEFDRRTIEALRQPLEERSISIARVSGRATLPASFILLAAMNPCPCGNRGTQTKVCTCTPGALQSYERKLSGPILDRIDIFFEVPQIAYAKLHGGERGEDSAAVRERVQKAREHQHKRYEKLKIKTNSEMSVREIEKFATLTPELRTYLDGAAQKLDLSPRSYHRVIKVARTIADLEGSENIKLPHLKEALSYRPKLARL